MKNRIQFPKTNWFDIKNVTKESADIYLYDEISAYVKDNNATDVVARLQGLKDVPTLNVRINSPGGSVFEGMAIFNALTRHPGKVITHVDGIAASIASVIAMAGSEINVADNAMMMIHNPAAFVFGEAGDLRKQADVLDQIKETIINVYTNRDDADKDDEKRKTRRTKIAQMMDEETWFTADDALTNKFATNKVSAMKMAACFDLQSFGFLKAPVPVDTAPPSSTTPRSLLERKQALLEKK
jgi:ATP-dependent protease ClpP protease subunit